MIGTDVRNRRLSVAALLVLCVTPAIWPLDAPFLNDEPVLIGLALQHNARGEVAQLGLVGTRGARYGPVAIWTYQALLAITHDIAALVQLHALLYMLFTAAALFALARALALPSLWAAIPLLSPYLWLYSRALWDNNLCIPLSAVAFAAYAWFLARQRAVLLALTLSALVLCTMVHLMALALAAPIGLHLLLTRRRFLLTRAGLLALVPAVSIAACGARFWLGLLAIDTSAMSAASEPGALWFASVGGRCLTAGGLNNFFGPAWSERFLSQGAAGLALPVSMLLGHGLVWAGMVRALVWTKRALADRSQRTRRVEIAALALGVWLAQTALNVATHTAGGPHYYNATWIAFVVFAWIALDGLVRFRLANYAAGAHALALATALAVIVHGLHQTGGTRSLHYGLSLREELLVAAYVGQSHPDSSLLTEVEQLQLFPQELTVLMLLANASPNPSWPRRLVRVHYASTDQTVAKLRVSAEPQSSSSAR